MTTLSLSSHCVVTVSRRWLTEKEFCCVSLTLTAVVVRITLPIFLISLDSIIRKMHSYECKWLTVVQWFLIPWWSTVLWRKNKTKHDEDTKLPSLYKTLTQYRTLVWASCPYFHNKIVINLLSIAIATSAEKYVLLFLWSC